MTIKPQGIITVASAGTPVAIFTADPSAPLPKYKVAKIRITPVPGNTGKLYVGKSGMNKTTGAGVIDVLDKAPTAGPFDRFAVESQNDSNMLFPDEYFIDADSSSDGAYVAFWEA